MRGTLKTSLQTRVWNITSESCWSRLRSEDPLHSPSTEMRGQFTWSCFCQMETEVNESCRLIFKVISINSSVACFSEPCYWSVVVLSSHEEQQARKLLTKPSPHVFDRVTTLVRAHARAVTESKRDSNLNKKFKYSFWGLLDELPRRVSVFGLIRDSAADSRAAPVHVCLSAAISAAQPCTLSSGWVNTLAPPPAQLPPAQTPSWLRRRCLQYVLTRMCPQNVSGHISVKELIVAM